MTNEMMVLLAIMNLWHRNTRELKATKSRKYECVQGTSSESQLDNLQIRKGRGGEEEMKAWDFVKLVTLSFNQRTSGLCKTLCISCMPSTQRLDKGQCIYYLAILKEAI
jgi:hypothetical protein